MMNTHMSDQIKERLSPDGTLFMTRDRATHLIRWIEITEKMLLECRDHMNEMKQIIEGLKAKQEVKQ